MKNAAIFLVEILAIVSFSLWAVAIEGPTGGGLDHYIYGGLSANFLIFYVTMPLFLLLPVLASRAFDSKLIGTVISGAMVGGVLQDFSWFLINPNFGVQKFTSVHATWLSWVNLGFFELPTFYVICIVVAVLSWFVFIRNSQKVERVYKNLKSRIS